MELLLSFSITTIIVFVLMLIFYRRTILIGGMFVLSMVSTGILLLYFKSVTKVLFTSTAGSILLLLIGGIIILMMLMGPVLISLVFLVSGAKLLKREGVSFRNLLSLMVGIMLIGSFIFSRVLIKYVLQTNITATIYMYIMLIVYYIVALWIVYVITLIINGINLPTKKIDYIIVLGCGLMKDKVTPLLASRVDKAIEISKKNPNAKIIMSGGQGEDELCSEAEAMKKYAIARGVEEDRIILEDQSTSTYENLVFSTRLMGSHKKVAIVTTRYHLLRALIMSRKIGLKAIGYGAKTKFYFSLNALIREFVGYLYYSRLFVISGGVLLSLGYAIIIYMLYNK